MNNKIIAVDLGGTNLRVALVKDNKIEQRRKMLKQKVYKSDIISSISMLPGNPKGLPDESLHKVFKVKRINSNIQVPGMAFRSNAGLPIQFIISTHNFWRQK